MGLETVGWMRMLDLRVCFERRQEPWNSHKSLRIFLTNWETRWLSMKFQYVQIMPVMFCSTFQIRFVIHTPCGHLVLRVLGYGKFR